MVTVDHIPINTGSIFLKLIKPVIKDIGTDRMFEEKNFRNEGLFFKI